MSTSVYNAERFSFKSISRRNRSTPEKVKRALFGPVDHDSNRVFMEKQLSIDYAKNCHKWNFNFHDEVPLDDDGDYVWMSPSPVAINRKRKTEIPDNSAFYFQPIEGSSAAPQLLETLKPIARSPELSKIRIPKQSLITDYLQKSKRQAPCSKDTDERPNKIQKLGSFCSS